MSPGSKVLVSAAVVGLVAGLVFWRKGQARDVRLAGVMRRPATMANEPGGAPGEKSVPKGIVVFVSKMMGEWAYVTVPASIADALFDLNQDVSGWVPFEALEDVVPRA